MRKNMGAVVFAVAGVAAAAFATRKIWMPKVGPVLLPENMDAFLLLIRSCEGTLKEGSNGYRVLVGGKLFNNGYVDHPNVYNPKLNSTAAGAYQFIHSTWDRIRRKLNLPDFTPASQDAAAVELIKERGAYDDVIAGRIDEALRKCSKEWASLPFSTAGQPKKNITQCRMLFQQYGGKIA